MKIKLLFTVFILTFLQNVSAQEYQPFLNNSSWILNDWLSCCRPPYIRTINEGTDVVIGAYTYKKFGDPFPGYDSNWNVIDTVFVREDAATKKVYKIFNGAEVILYDFSLEVGDTFPQEQYIFTVVAVDEVVVNGGVRKRLKLQTDPPEYAPHTFTQYWIEGVGSDAHPFYPERNMTSVLSASGGYKIYTKCSFQNGAHIYGNSDYCSPVPLKIESATLITEEIVFYPNPVTTALSISSGSVLQNATFKLFNLQGRLVREIHNLNGKKIVVDRGNLNSGLYLVQLFENQKLIKSAKMMVD